jgi:predicted ATP-grasp superfamily ATP-dependent carboligase
MMRMVSPRILVHEFITGGGWPEPELPPALAAEALAILQAVLADLRAWGTVHTTTTLDHRLCGIQLAADQVTSIHPDRHQATLLELASRCDAALIIAPESGGVHGRLCRWLESAGVPLLGASAAAVAVAADKWRSYHLFRNHAIPTPDTWLLNGDGALTTVRALRQPLVIKPRHGTGAEGVGLVAHPAHTCPGTGEWLLQDFVPGVHASVSLLSNGEQTVPLSLNAQNIEVGERFIYRGGRIPLEHPLRARALSLAQQAVSLIPGLRGYVGVDLVLTPEACYVIEINPRPTTSYVGLRQIINLNLAEAIWRAWQDGRLPHEVTLAGPISFGKDGVHD